MNRNYFRLIRNLTNASSAWHIQQSAALGLMPLISSLLMGELKGAFLPEEREMKGVSDEGQKLLNRYVSLSAEPYVSERETWLYDYFPMKMGDVLTIPIAGAISQEDYCGTAGTQTIMGWYQKAAADSSIKAIIETKNTPGGEVFGTRALAETKLNIGKPIIGFTQGLECSAGLYIGATDSYKFASSNDCLIGSCGVMTTFQNWSAWYEKNGIIVTDLYSKDSPLKNDAYRKAMKGDYKGYTDGILFKLDKSFMSFMQQYRPGISAEALKGAEFMSDEAIEAGIIDQIGNFNEAYQFAQEAIKSPNILQKSNSNQMAKKTFFLSKLVADFKNMLGNDSEIVDDVTQKADDPTETNTDGAPDEKADEEGKNPTAETTVTPTATTTPPVAGTPPTATNPTAEDKDAEIAKLQAEANKWKAQALKGKSTIVPQKGPDASALKGADLYEGLTMYEG